MNIERLNFKVKTYNTLKRNGIDTVEDIAGHIGTLQDIKNVGPAMEEEILDKVSSHLHLGIGADKSCFAYVAPTAAKRSKCRILKNWYHPEAGRECLACPFYKARL